MADNRRITVADAAVRLGVSQSTVRIWIRHGRLQGEAGDQPVRPRWSVVCDQSGHPLGADNQPLQTSSGSGSTLEQIALLEQRVSSIEALVAAGPGAGERFRDAALQLNAAMDHQRRAFQLQLEATKALDEAVAEQAAIIAGLLIGDPHASVVNELSPGGPSVVQNG